MKYVARARTERACVYKPCSELCRRIYEDEHWRVVACCDEHADEVGTLLEQAGPALSRALLTDFKGN